MIAEPEAEASPEEAPAGPEEIELKYAVLDPPALRRWLEEPSIDGVDAGPWTTRVDEDAYVDTADRDLERAGYGARLRRRGSDITLTIKSLGNVGAAGHGTGHAVPKALHRRLELEGPATRALDPAEWPESEARELVERLAGGSPLRIRFVVQQRREARMLRDDTGATAELSLDDVTVRSRDRVAGRFTALEVEAIDGSTSLLERVAGALDSTGLVAPEPRSKEAIAAELVEPERAWVRSAAAVTDDEAAAVAAEAVEAPEAAEAIELGPAAEVAEAEAAELAEAEAVEPGTAKPPRSPAVRADDTLAEAGRKVLRMHLMRMLAYEAGTREGVVEDLHKMRVATRRMRAAWRVFDGAYRSKLQRRYVGELRQVATALGTVRDLDVQIEGLEAYIQTLPGPGADAMQPLLDDWRGRRDSARDELMGLLDSQDYADFVDDYRDFVDHPGAGVAPPEPGVPVLVRDTAAGRIWNAYEHVRAHDTTLPWADVPQLHALRIDAKRLRYTLEFFREVLPPATDSLIARVIELQDHLGLLNDADVAARNSRSFLVAQASRLPASSREAIGHYLDSREAEIARLRRLFPPVWRKVNSPPFRRTLAFSVGAL